MSDKRLGIGLLAAALLLAVSAAGACDGGASDGDDLDGEFLQGVALPDRTFDVYWLGRSFEAGGMTYEGPSISATGSLPTDKGMSMTYYARPNPDEAGYALYVSVSDPGAFATGYAEPQGATTHPISAIGLEGKLVRVPRRPDGVDGRMFIILYAPNATITVGVSNALDRQHPLYDEGALLGVAELLRVYPEQ